MWEDKAQNWQRGIVQKRNNMLTIKMLTTMDIQLIEKKMEELEEAADTI